MQRPSLPSYRMAVFIILYQVTFIKTLATIAPEPAIVQLKHATSVPPALGLQPNSTLLPLSLDTNATFYIHTPQTPSEQLPAILLFNGFSVEAVWYSGVAGHLSTLGYTVAVSEYRRRFPFPIPDLPRPGCRPDFTAASADLFPTVMHGDVLNTQQGADGTKKLEEFRKAANTNGVVVLAHSAGGPVAINFLLTPQSNDCSLNGKGQLSSGRQQLFCEGYSPTNTSSLPPVLGMVTYEAYANRSDPAYFRNGTFMVAIVGASSPPGMSQFEEANFTTVDGAPVCKSLVVIDGNHFGLNDFVPNVGGKQVTPCARTASSPKEKNFTITEANQKKNVELVATITDAMIRMAVGSEGSRQEAAKMWAEDAKNERILQSNVNVTCMESLDLGFNSSTTAAPPSPPAPNSTSSSPNNTASNSGMGGRLMAPASLLVVACTALFAAVALLVV